MRVLAWSARAVALIAVVAALALAYAYEREERALRSPMPLDAPVDVRVAPGTTFSALASDLAARGLVRSPRFFTLYARLAGKAQAIKAGTYRLAPGASALDALDLIVSGRELQIAFTIVEGWTFDDLRRALAADATIEQVVAELEGGDVMTRLGRPDRHPEGMFLADTYHFPVGASDLDVLARAMAALDARLEDAWSRRAEDLPLASTYETLILASIVEKETAIANERPRVAGVFVERLRRGMRLQTDPTVIYGLGSAFDGNLRRRDLRADTPYNTYTRAGLPPTPIALVGGDAIEAVVRPRIDGSLYFVSRGDGSHEFSRTYDEHARAVRRYQLGGRSARGG